MSASGSQPPSAAASSPTPAVLLISEPLPRPSVTRQRSLPLGADTAAPDSDVQRLGKAVHRFLEWAVGPPEAAPDPAVLARAAAAEFAVAAADEVLRLGRRILESADCARFLHGPSLRWAGNEVGMSDGGEALRIDRLVLLDGDDDGDGTGPVWWVLDYKLQQSPAELPAYRDQLLRYRRLVQQAQPGARVRCAFIIGSGAVVEMA